MFIPLPVLLFVFISQSKTAPISTTTPTPPLSWTSLERRTGLNVGDSFTISTATATAQGCNCSAFGAESTSNNEIDTCSCQCPSRTPIFLQRANKCSDGLGDDVECERPISFRSDKDPSKELKVPVVALQLPAEGGVPVSVPFTPPHLKILWKESAIKVKANVGVRCSISGLNLMDVDGEWLGVKNHWFSIGWNHNDVKVLWNITAFNANLQQQLMGSIIRLTLECPGRKSGEVRTHCLAMRVAGVIHQPSLTHNNNNGTASAVAPRRAEGRLETILIILLSILLFLSLFGSILLWQVCWRWKKSELVSSLQLQFLYHARQNKERAQAEAHQRYEKAMAATGEALARLYNRGAGEEEVIGDSTCAFYCPSITSATNSTQSAPIQAKRKLYFSAEFFDPQLMAHPPPMAEQFLFDLRRMISMAKQRIHMRRHISRLGVIPEEESKQSKVEEEGVVRSQSPLEDGSPRSLKSSSESGRGTNESEGEGDGDGSDESNSPPHSEVEEGGGGLECSLPRDINILTSSSLPSVKQLVKGFEHNTAAMTHKQVPNGSTTTTTRIPMAVGAKSPRPLHKTMAILSLLPSANRGDKTPPPTNNKQRPALAPPLPPRNSPLLPSTPPPPTPPYLAAAAVRAAMKQKAGYGTTASVVAPNSYTVYPSDFTSSMLKKSLPRRSKNNLINGQKGAAVVAVGKSPFTNGDLKSPVNRKGKCLESQM